MKELSKIKGVDVPKTNKEIAKEIVGKFYNSHIYFAPDIEELISTALENRVEECAGVLIHYHTLTKEDESVRRTIKSLIEQVQELKE